MEPDALDPVWKALANPVRRKMLDLLRDEPLTTGDLSSAFPELSRFAIMQHLDVLEDANLIVVRRAGRQRYNYLNAVPIRQIYERWVKRYEGHWASALLALRDSLEEDGADRSGAASPPPAKSKNKKKKTSRRKKRSGGTSKDRSSTSSRRHGKGKRND